MAAWPKDSPWRQGHVLPKAAVQKLKLSHPDADPGEEDDTVVVVISHDCDIAPSPEKEAFVEVIVGIEIEKPNGNFTHGKSPRTLHLRFSAGTQDLFVELDAREKEFILKEDLAEFEPGKEALLAPRDFNILQAWLASRYRRAAFPDSFVARWSAALEGGFKKILGNAGSQLFAIYFDLDNGADPTERSDPEDCYDLTIYLVYNVEPDKEAAKQVAESVRRGIEALFRATCIKNGKPINIDLLDCIPVAETEMTLYAINKGRLYRWSTDHISLKEDPQGPIPK